MTQQAIVPSNGTAPATTKAKPTKAEKDAARAAEKAAIEAKTAKLRALVADYTKADDEIAAIKARTAGTAEAIYKLMGDEKFYMPDGKLVSAGHKKPKGEKDNDEAPTMYYLKTYEKEPTIGADLRSK